MSARSHDASEELRTALMKLARRIRINRAVDDLGDTQVTVLSQLEQSDRSPSELAAHEQVAPPSMNRTINGLESAGLVTRQPDDGDARRVRVSITPAGRSILADTRAARSAWFVGRLAGLTPEERRALEAVTPIIRRLADS